MSLRLRASMLGGVVIFTTPCALADIQEIVQLGTLSGDDVSAFAINDALRIVGTAQLNSGTVNAYLWDGTLMDLEFHGSARDITASGRIAGFLLVGNDAEAIVWEDGVLTPLGTFPNGTDSQAFAINESDLIVGHARTEDDFSLPVIFENGGVTDLGTLGGKDGGATDVNDVGQIVGRARNAQGQNRAFLYENGQMQDLGTLGGLSSVAEGINNLGQIVGHSLNDINDQHAFLYTKKTAAGSPMQDLGTLGGDQSQALDVNDHGLVVGWSRLANGSPHAFLYRDNEMIDLNDWLPPNSGWTDLTIAHGVNNVGQIVGEGIWGGDTRAFLIILVPTTPGDLNGDGVVNAADLAILLGDWGPYFPCTPHRPADLDLDCDVDAGDLAILLGAWG